MRAHVYLTVLCLCVMTACAGRIGPVESLSPSGTETITVQLSPGRAEGCDVAGALIKLSDRVVRQEGDKPIVFEAEDADVLVFQSDKALVELKKKKKGIDQDYHVETKTWTPQELKSASGGKYIDWVSYAEYRFHVVKAGEYVRWVRYAVPGPSFYHSESIDDEEPYWDLEMPKGKKLSWQWKPAEVRLRAPYKRVYYNLDKGDHTLKFHTYYNGARLDKIVLTRDKSWKPEGVGPAPTPRVKAIGGTVLMKELKPPVVRSWQGVEISATKNGGKVIVEYSTDGAETFAPLPANGSLKHVKAAGDGSDKLALRVRLERSVDGKSPVVHGVNVKFNTDADSIVTLENKQIRIRFDRRRGKLLTLERIGKTGAVNRAWQPSSIFDVSLKKPGKPEITVIKQDAAKLTTVKIIQPKKHVRFEYALAEGKVALNIDIRLDETEQSRWSAHVVNNLQETDVIRVKFPILTGLRIGPDGRDDMLVVPDHSGKIINNPGQASRRSYKYPGSASLCYLDLCDKSVGVLLAGYDPELINTAIEYKPAGTNDQVDMWMEKCNRIRARGFEARYEFAVAVHKGDWHRGADLYREWFHKTLGTAQLPEWFANSDGYLAFGIPNHVAKFNTLPKWYQVARWMGYTHLQCWGQSNGPRGNCCPTYYYPSPFYGTPKDFAAANKAIRDAGGHVGYYFHSQAINRLNMSRDLVHSAIDRKVIPDYLKPPTYDFYFRIAQVGPDGKLPGPPNYHGMAARHAIGKHANDFPKVVMWAKEWQAYLQFWAVWMYAAQWNVDCFYFDVLGASAARESFNPYRGDNGEGYHGMGQIGIVTEVIQKGKPYIPEPGILGEGCCDTYGRMAAHMISGFDKFPEVFRYTMPDQVVFSGHSNTGYAKAASIIDKAHLYGNRFDMGVVSAYTRRHGWFRKQFKHWLYRARFMDNVGLLGKPPSIQAKLHVRDEPKARGVLVTLVNSHPGLSGNVVVSTAPVGRIQGAIAYTMWGLPKKIAFTQTDDRVTFTAPTGRISAVLLAAKTEGAETVALSGHFETSPDKAFAVVALANLTSAKRTVLLENTKADGFSIPKKTSVTVGAGKVVLKRFPLGDPAAIADRRYIGFRADATAPADVEIPAGAVFIGGTFEDREAEEPRIGSYIDGKTAASGTKSLCMVSGEKKGNLIQHFKLNVKPATRYRLTMKMKRTTKHNIYAILYQKIRDARGVKLGDIIGRTKKKVGDWETYTREFQTDPDILNISLYVYNRTKNAKVWFDDISVVEIGTAK